MPAKTRTKGPDNRTELLAGFTTFFTVSYILLLNPRFLGAAGMPAEHVFVATALSAGLASLLMGILANRPFAVAAGMGFNAYFAYAVVLGMGFSWQAALAAVFVSGFLLLLLSLARVDLGSSIPESFKFALIGGLGLFLVFIGLQNAHIVSSNPATIVSLGNLSQPAARIAVLGFFITGMLVVRKVPGGLLLGILSTTFLGMLLGLSPWPAGLVRLPSFSLPLAFQLDFSRLFSAGMLSVVWSFFIVALLDILGTLTALSIKAGFVDPQNRVQGLEKSMQTNAFAILLGAALGVPTIVTYLESATGIEAGGRTGKVAIVVGLLFLLALFFFPLIEAIPVEAAAPAIVLVGVLMLSALGGVNYRDPTDALPALLTLVTIPFTFSIAHGIAIGSVFYVFLKLVSGRFKEIPVVMYAIAALSLLDLAGVF